ncbi:uncharacterized protein LOC130817630 [Amaranthus tricolor]|uniref:uncharacterized protein LOC130817630 n=1 Tax=Amaranthus tricolor TaxID=29722 RepID=UPI002589050D|nr:uncharacterized protein LOC130817630 [Amaranthus tricolor]XP_057539438.1 uncharacterized protein LOC130817630 [Amaranthus tricolor]XP_057539439.1 uncharacterized protein LOC130817630 [Amaranthus tricolor]
MGISKTEINLRRLLAAAPQQQNHTKLIHYVATLRELLEQLTEEITPEGLPRVSKAKVNDYSEKIESIASKLVSSEEIFVETSPEEIPLRVEEVKVNPLPGLRKRSVPSSYVEERSHDNNPTDPSSLVKLDADSHSHIDKHRKLQEDLTDEMVGMARQLKESSLLISQSIQNAEKILDSTEKAVEHSLASTNHANVRATNVFSRSSKTSCFTWLLMFVMLMVFMMVIFIIRIT